MEQDAQISNRLIDQAAHTLKLLGQYEFIDKGTGRTMGPVSVRPPLSASGFCGPRSHARKSRFRSKRVVTTNNAYQR